MCLHGWTREQGKKSVRSWRRASPRPRCREAMSETSYTIFLVLQCCLLISLYFATVIVVQDAISNLEAKLGKDGNGLPACVARFVLLRPRTHVIVFYAVGASQSLTSFLCLSISYCLGS